MSRRAVEPHVRPRRGARRGVPGRRAAAWLAALTLAAGCGSTPPPPDPWLAVRHTEDPAQLEAFASAHPESPHAADARARREELLESRDRARAEEAGTREAYVAYLEQHPEAPFADAARAAVARLDEEREADTRAAQVAFLSAFPDSAHAAESRAAIERFDHAADLARARELDTLAAWEAFVRAHPGSDRRAEAGARIEALVDQASPADRAELERARARIRESRERDTDPERRRFYAVELRLAEPGGEDRFLIKTEGYDYLAIGKYGAEPAPEAFEEPLLRYLPPLLTVVTLVSEETLFDDEEEIDRLRIRIYSEMTRAIGVDFYATQLVTCWPRDVEAFDLGDGRFSTQRGLLGNVLTPEQLLASLLRLPDRHVPWAAAKIAASGTEPPDLESRALLVAAAGDDEGARGLDPDARPTLLRILDEAPPDFATRAARTLALNDPSGSSLDVLAGEPAEKAVGLLADVVHADPALAADFAPGGLAWQARERGRERLLVELHGQDDDALAAAEKLVHFGWDPDEPSNAVRLLALRGDWSRIETGGAESVVPLLALLGEGEVFHGVMLSYYLERLAATVGPLPEAGERLLRDDRLRARIVTAGWGPKLHGLFEGDALDYLRAAASPEEVRAFAAATSDPEWAALARAWTRDAAGRDLAALSAEGKIAVTARGVGISSVHVEIENLCDHDVLALLRPGLRFEPPDARYQNMVTTRARDVPVARGSTESFGVAAACANQHRRIPVEEVRFELARVDAASDLGRLLAVLAEREISYSVAQAAIWVLTDDAGWEQISGLQRIRVPSLSGMRIISDDEALAALELLDELGVDFRATRLWKDRRLLRHYDEGWHNEWLERMEAEQGE